MKTKEMRFCHLTIYEEEKEYIVYSYASLIYIIDKPNKIIQYDPYYLNYSATTSRHFTKALKKAINLELTIHDLREFYQDYKEDGCITEYNGYKFQPIFNQFRVNN